MSFSISQAQRKNIWILWKINGIAVSVRTCLSSCCFQQHWLCAFCFVCWCKLRIYYVNTITAPSRIPCGQYIFMEHRRSLNDRNGEKRFMQPQQGREESVCYCSKRCNGVWWCNLCATQCKKPGYQWWSVTKYNYFVTVLKYIFQVSVLYWSSFILSNFYFYFTTFQSIRSYFLLHYIS